MFVTICKKTKNKKQASSRASHSLHSASSHGFPPLPYSFRANFPFAILSPSLSLPAHLPRRSPFGHPMPARRWWRLLDEQAADFLAILYDESRGSYRTVATGCLRETRCGLIAIH